MLAFTAPWFLLGLLGVPVVILLHFIRRARRVRRVSALWLWGAQEAPSRRARFNPNLLLLLQILTVIFASLGAAGPVFGGLGREVAVIVDASGAFAATDQANGDSRLAVALREASGVVRGSSRATVVRAGLSATLLTSGSSDEATRALEGVVAADSRADLAGALGLVRSVAPNAEVHLWTSSDAPAGFNGTLHRVLGGGENVGITAFALRGQQVFAALESNAVAPKTVNVNLERDGKRVLSVALRVPGGSRATWTPKLEITPGTYRLRLEGRDALILDDEAYASVSTVRALVTPSQDDVLRAVVSVPGVRAAVQDVPPSTASGYDLVVLVGAVPKSLPPGQYLIFAPLPTEREAAALGAPTRVTSSDPTDAVLRFADLEGVRARISSVAPPVIPDGSWRAIASAGERAFVLRGEGPGVRAVFIAAHPLESDLRRLPAFPVLVYNLVQEFGGARNVPLGSSLPAGNVFFNGANAGAITRALLPGVYDIGRTRVTANLVSSAATRLPTGTSTVQTIGTLETSGRSSAAPLASSLGALLLLLALVALALEAALRGGFDWDTLRRRGRGEVRA
jgi:hypothetical protein